MLRRSFAITCLLMFFSLLAQAALTKALEASDPLAKAAKSVGTSLSDGNISTGTTSLTARILTAKAPKTIEQMKELTRDLFKEKYGYHLETNLPDDSRVTVRTFSFKDSVVNDVADALAEGNAYSPENKEGLAQLRRQVWAVLRKLPVDDDTKVGTVKTRVKSEVTDGMTSIYYFVFLDSSTRKLVQVFVIEGTM